MTIKIKKETRYYGPGLPAEGISDPIEAYRLGLIHARERGALAWAREIGGALGPFTAIGIAEHWEALVRAISAATDSFVTEHGFALDRAIDAIEGEGDDNG